MLSRRHPVVVRAQRGLSLVELMVGIAVGLVIVAAASLVMTSQMVENRRLLSETLVQQDLRAAGDIMAREMRRAGSDREFSVLAGMWQPGSPGTLRNTLTTLSTGSTRIDFDYYSGSGVVGGPFAFQLDGVVLKTLLGIAMQDLTDPNSMKVTGLTSSVSTDASATIPLPCPTVCTGPDPTACWPNVIVRTVRVGVNAEAKSDANVKRTLGSTVLVRNDVVRFSDALNNKVCPGS